MRTRARLAMASAEIRDVAVCATDAAGVRTAVATQSSPTSFRPTSTFHRDLRKGDHFSVVYEVCTSRRSRSRPGACVAAEFINQGKASSAVFFEAMLKTRALITPRWPESAQTIPALAARVLAHHLRLHPCPLPSGVADLARAQRHRLRCTSGTRVNAAGDGGVEFAGSQGGYGNVVVLRHQSKAAPPGTATCPASPMACVKASASHKAR